MSTKHDEFPLSQKSKILLSLISFAVVALGQPAWSWQIAVLASIFGYALFFRVLLGIKRPRSRFFLGTIWFASTQFFQLSWVSSHPFFYIYAFWVIWPLLLGLQFGCVAYLVTPPVMTVFAGGLALSGLWTLMEWARLFILSGYAFNPSGLALTASLYSLQLASVGGVLGLSFWVMLVNTQVIRAWVTGGFRPWVTVLIFALLPYSYGFWVLHNHEQNRQKSQETLTALLVQTAFPVEVSLREQKDIVGYVTNQWRKVLEITKHALNTKLDLIALPEYVVPFGTYTFVYPYDKVQQIFKEVLGEDVLPLLPQLDSHLGVEEWTLGKSEVLVNNAYWLQAIANVYNSAVVAGLSDVDGVTIEERKYYSVAQFFLPLSNAPPERYEKRVLVPLGEYIPFEFCRHLAASYGIQGSFTSGVEAKVFSHPTVPFGASICYEETFGDLMRENRVKGAEMLVNLTNDAWFPDSRLTKQHLDHGRVRTVENGVPLLRCCNTGKTAAIDSTGRVLLVLGEDQPNQESISDSLLVTLPRYHYQTIYSRFGDLLVVCLSVLCIGFYFVHSKR